MRRASNAVNWTKGQKTVKKLANKLFVTDSSAGNARKVHLSTENLFWIAVHLTGIVMTALTCRDMYQQYQQNPVTLTITPFHNETMTLPNPTICLPFFEAGEVVEQDLFGADAFFHAPTESSYYLEILPGPYINLLNKFFDKYASWKEVQEAIWTTPIIYIAQSYLGMIYEIESVQKGIKNPIPHLIDYYTDNNVSIAIVEVLLPKMKEWNVSLGQFRDTFAFQFKNFFPITVFDSNGTNCNVSQDLVFVGKHQVCYRLGLDIFNLTVASNNIKLMSDSSNIQFQNLPGPEPITIDISGKARAGSIIREFDLMYFAHLKDQTFLTVNPMMQYVSQSTVLGVQKCSVDETAEICQGKCRNKEIRKSCNCSASTVSLQQPSNDMGCLIGQYELCLLNFTGEEDANCTKQCLDSCTQWQYDVQKYIILYSWKEYNTSDFTPFIDITVSTHNYLLCEEFSAWTVDAIIGTIGGAVGFWLRWTFCYYRISALVLRD